VEPDYSGFPAGHYGYMLDWIERHEEMTRMASLLEALKEKRRRCRDTVYALGPTPLICGLDKGHEEKGGTPHHDLVRDKKWMRGDLS
jgi:hypothetical protein